MPNRKNLFLIRHAQTILNSELIIQGQKYESDLSVNGHKQAEVFYETFKHIPIDKIYISGLKRTYDSVINFIQNNIPFEIIPELNEINWGIIEGNKFEGETKIKYIEITKRWKNGDYNARMENGESAFDVEKRLLRAIDSIMQSDIEQNIFLVTHNRTLKILLCILLKVEMSQMDIFNHKNLTLYQISHHDQNFILIRKTNWNEKTNFDSY